MDYRYMTRGKRSVIGAQAWGISRASTFVSETRGGAQLCLSQVFKGSPNSSSLAYCDDPGFFRLSVHVLEVGIKNHTLMISCEMQTIQVPAQVYGFSNKHTTSH